MGIRIEIIMKFFIVIFMGIFMCILMGIESTGLLKKKILRNIYLGFKKPNNDLKC